jgi:AbrB family looped-hinge helix DNA binding protein
MTSSVSSKGQITIPAAIREKLQLSTGCSVEFVVLGEGEVLLRKRLQTAEPLLGYLSHLAPAVPLTTESLDEAIGQEVARLEQAGRAAKNRAKK